VSYNSFALHPEMYNNKLQIISPSRKYQLVAAFTTQLLQYQAVPREGVYVGAFVYERTLHRVYCKRNQCSAITFLNWRGWTMFLVLYCPNPKHAFVLCLKSRSGCSFHHCLKLFRLAVKMIWKAFHKCDKIKKKDFKNIFSKTMFIFFRNQHKKSSKLKPQFSASSTFR